MKVIDTLMVVLDGVQGGACKVSVFLGVESLCGVYIGVQHMNKRYMRSSGRAQCRRSGTISGHTNMDSIVHCHKSLFSV